MSFSVRKVKDLWLQFEVLNSEKRCFPVPSAPSAVMILAVSVGVCVGWSLDHMFGTKIWILPENMGIGFIGAAVAQWFRKRTLVRKVSGSSPAEICWALAPELPVQSSPQTFQSRWSWRHVTLSQSRILKKTSLMFFYSEVWDDRQQKERNPCQCRNCSPDRPASSTWHVAVVTQQGCATHWRRLNVFLAPAATFCVLVF